MIHGRLFRWLRHLPADIRDHPDNLVPPVVSLRPNLAVGNANALAHRIVIAKDQMRERLVHDENVAALSIQRREIPAHDDTASKCGEEA
jgi:hypothetical protein